MNFRSWESKRTEGCGEGGREHWPPCAAARLARLDPPAARGGLEGSELSSAAGFSPAGHRRCPGALGTQASLPGGVAILSPLSLSCLAEDSGNISVWWGASSLLTLLPRCAGMQSVAVRRPDVIRAQRKASAYTTFPTHTQSPSSPTASLYPTSFDQLACRG